MSPLTDEHSTLAACPTGDTSWTVAHNPRGDYDLVTFGAGDYISDACLRGNGAIFWEERESSLIVALLRSASLNTTQQNHDPTILTHPWFLDLGSNIGVHSVYTAASGFPVVSIEASPPAAARQRCSLSLNSLSKRVILLNAALGMGSLNEVETPGVKAPHTSTLCLVSPHKDNAGQNHIAPPGTVCPPGAPRVPLLTLDGLFEFTPLTIPTPTVLKMDVEGFEAYVLKGGERWLKRARPPFILLELQPSLLARSGSKWQDVLQFLFDLGYHIYGSGDGGREITPLDYNSEEKAAAFMDINGALGRCNFDLIIKKSPDPFPVDWPPNLCHPK